MVFVFRLEEDGVGGSGFVARLGLQEVLHFILDRVDLSLEFRHAASFKYYQNLVLWVRLNCISPPIIQPIKFK